MFLGVHATVGALVGGAVGNPATAFALNFFGHFLLDMIPHGDDHLYNEYKRGNSRKKAISYTGTDILATIAIVGVILATNSHGTPISVIAGIVGGLLPDVIVGICEIVKPRKSWLGRKLRRFHAFHMWNHHVLLAKFRNDAKDIPLKYGFILQVMVLAVLMKVIL